MRVWPLAIATLHPSPTHAHPTSRIKLALLHVHVHTSIRRSPDPVTKKIKKNKKIKRNKGKKTIIIEMLGARDNAAELLGAGPAALSSW